MAYVAFGIKFNKLKLNIPTNNNGNRTNSFIKLFPNVPAPMARTIVMQAQLTDFQDIIPSQYKLMYNYLKVWLIKYLTNR